MILSHIPSRDILREQEDSESPSPKDLEWHCYGFYVPHTFVTKGIAFKTGFVLAAEGQTQTRIGHRSIRSPQRCSVSRGRARRRLNTRPCCKYACLPCSGTGAGRQCEQESAATKSVRTSRDRPFCFSRIARAHKGKF